MVAFWVQQGVKVFRVDNPHTKPFHFWEWLILEIRKDSPEVIFLAEAFTRPQVMGYLAKAGFSQSYTYFTWRNTKWELTEYLTQLTKTELVNYFGPNFWPNTPDILPHVLQVSDRGLYIARLALAATLSSNYGIYGPAYELLISKPFHPGGEEYLDSEKYEIKVWDLNRPESIAPIIKKINQLRHEHKALQQNASIEFHNIPNEQLLAFSKTYGDEIILIVVNLKPDTVQMGQLDLPLKEWEIAPTEGYEVEELLTGTTYSWMGWKTYVEIRPERLPVQMFKIKKPELNRNGMKSSV